jgi:predicted hydrocarbon binding protein
VVRRFPAGLRARWALGLSRRLVAQTFKGSKARIRMRKGTGSVGIHASIFCTVRETAAWPMCVFYSAAVERFLQHFGVEAQVHITECRAHGGSDCTMVVTFPPTPATAEAA